MSDNREWETRTKTLDTLKTNVILGNGGYGRVPIQNRPEWAEQYNKRSELPIRKKVLERLELDHCNVGRNIMPPGKMCESYRFFVFFENKDYIIKRKYKKSIRTAFNAISKFMLNLELYGVTKGNLNAIHSVLSYMSKSKRMDYENMKAIVKVLKNQHDEREEARAQMESL